MTATLNTRGHRLSIGVVRGVALTLSFVLLTMLFLESRIGLLSSVAALVAFAAWVGLGQSEYEVSTESLRVSTALRSTTLQRDEILGASWDRDELSIEELTVHGRAGRSIALSKGDLANNPSFAEPLRLFLVNALGSQAAESAGQTLIARGPVGSSANLDSMLQALATLTGDSRQRDAELSLAS